MSNTRIEREALTGNRSDTGVHGYIAGATAEYNRAAPVVKALEDRLKEWETAYQAECIAIDRINKERRKPLFWDGDDYMMKYPPIPDWITEAKQILETYKADV